MYGCRSQKPKLFEEKSMRKKFDGMDETPPFDLSSTIATTILHPNAIYTSRLLNKQ